MLQGGQKRIFLHKSLHTFYWVIIYGAISSRNTENKKSEDCFL